MAVSFDKLHHISNTLMGRVIFKAWHGVTQEAKRTREYFEVINQCINDTSSPLFVGVIKC